MTSYDRTPFSFRLSWPTAENLQALREDCSLLRLDVKVRSLHKSTIAVRSSSLEKQGTGTRNAEPPELHRSAHFQTISQPRSDESRRIELGSSSPKVGEVSQKPADITLLPSS